MQDVPATCLTILGTILASFDRHADKPLVEYRGRWHTGRDLRGMAAGYAAALAEAGIGRGDALAVVVSDNLSAMLITYGAWMRGAGVLHIDFRTTASRLRDMAARIDAKRIVAVRPVEAENLLLLPRQMAPVETLPSDLPDDGTLIAEWGTSSGTTGLPRLIPTTQARAARRIALNIALGERGIWGDALSALSVAFGASRNVWMRNLAAGERIYAMDLVYRLSELDAALQREGLVECTLPPVLIRQLAALQTEDTPRYPRLQKLQAVGGPAAPEDKVNAVRRLCAGYVMTYSSTDCGVATRITGAEVLARPSSVGRAVEGITLRILQGGVEVPRGTVGEIHVSSADIPEVCPGDLGWMDDKGYLYVTGRKQGMLCRRGVNFRAESLVDAALSVPVVTDAAIVALPDDDQGDYVVLFIETATEGLDETIAALIPAAERPDRMISRKTLPRGPGGKVEVQQLRAELERERNGEVHV